MDIGVLLHNPVLPRVMLFQVFMSFILPLLLPLNAHEAVLNNSALTGHTPVQASADG